MLAPARSAARPAVRTFSASPWGTDHWRHDKQAFKAWAKEASEPGSSKAKRELYGFLALSFGDVDTDKDGLINAEQFDQLLAEVAALPRRYGLAPLDVGDAVSRAVNHKILFDSLDTKNGPARGVLGLDQFIEWAYDHVVTHVPKVPAKDVGLYHVEDYSEEEYIGFVEKAVNNPGSYEHASFYNFILNCFVEADEQCQGRITYDQFDKLLSRAATVPRHFGLAPPESSTEARKKMFDELELQRGGKGTGYVTARTFWEWTVVHVKGMIELQKAGKGWRENH
jgi:hypothetical protein